MTTKRLCQQKHTISFGKKYYVWIRLYMVAFVTRLTIGLFYVSYL